MGAPKKPLPVNVFNLLLPRRNLPAAPSAASPKPRKCSLCAEHGIVSDVEMIKIDYINEAWERVVKADVKYRFVIDMASLKN